MQYTRKAISNKIKAKMRADYYICWPAAGGVIYVPMERNSCRSVTDVAGIGREMKWAAIY